MTEETPNATAGGSPLDGGVRPVAPLTNGRRYINAHEGTDLPSFYVEANGGCESFKPYELVESSELERLRNELFCAQEDVKKWLGLVDCFKGLMRLDAEVHKRDHQLLYVAEYGAVSLPPGHPSRLVGAEVFAQLEDAERFVAEAEFDARVLVAVPLGPNKNSATPPVA